MSPERNLLIEAGAGTGKTTRLVKAVLQALFIRQLPLESLVALTFTNKAAGELKERVGLALDETLQAASIDTLQKKPWWPSQELALPLSDLQALARIATSVLDRANISTIHSFAFALLKRFPLAAGIDPEAAIDDKKLKFDELFRREWPLWLAAELGEKPPREALWLELLSHISLSEIEETARLLGDFDVPLDSLRISDADVPNQVAVFHQEARALSAAHSGNFKADEIARACEEVLGSYSQKKDPELSAEGIAQLQRDAGGSTQSWTEPEIRRLKFLQAVARNLIASGDHVIARLTEILEPFVRQFRRRLLTEGCLTHAALLVLSREILKNNREIRAALKSNIGLILIDEFQDTDPLQAELLLYLAEKDGYHADRWDTVQLAPGKLFIVGDPKQSIYRFRGADIAAYERIGKLVTDQGGLRETLEVNFRSQEQVIHVVNQAFDRIMIPEPDISPPYVPVTPHHPKDPAHAVQDVAIWLAESPTEQTVEEAQATEAEHVARWIKESVGQLTVHDPREGQRRPLLYRDVALIFRTYSPMDRFIEGLRRHQIPFAVESERYFFTTPEVTDFINLLRAADDPDDQLSLVGFLRGGLGGQTDEEILKHKTAGTLEELESVRWLRTLTARLRREPLSAVLASLFEDTWLLDLAVRSYHGDQTVANLLKLRRLLERFASEGPITLGVLLQRLDLFFADDTIEGESPLADENYNAVRLLTVHKAKGLEYPVVFLPSLHSELRAHPAESCLFDWRSQTLGLQAAGFCNLAKLELDEQTRRREAAEENRILYVAMTRARERLVLCGGTNLKTSRSRTYLQRLLEALGQSLGSLKEGDLLLGRTSLTVRRLDRVQVTEGAPAAEWDNPLTRVDPASFAHIWKDRAARCLEAQATPRTNTPSTAPHSARTAERDDAERDADQTTVHEPRQTAALLGTLLHRFLEGWDFTCEKCSMPAKLRQVANAYLANKGLLRTPFPDPKTGEPTFSPDDPMTDLAHGVGEAQKILAEFIDSEAYEEIKTATVLGREVPFFYKTGALTLTRGTMDILYRLPDGKLVIGDYKSDSELGARSAELKYAAQADAYREAVQRALGEKALFKIISLREGQSFAVK